MMASRSAPAGIPVRVTSWAATLSRTLWRSASTSGWSYHRNRTLRASSPTTGNRSWVAVTSRSRTSR